MQVNQKTIQRPQLFAEFFTDVLIWNNEFLTYIKTTTRKATKNVTSTLSNFSIKTKQELKKEYESLSKLSKKLFKTLPNSRKEFDEVQNKISKLLKSSSEKEIIKENPITHYPDNYYWLNRCPLFLNEYEDYRIFIYREKGSFHFVENTDCSEQYKEYIKLAKEFSIFKV